MSAARPSLEEVRTYRERGRRSAYDTAVRAWQSSGRITARVAIARLRASGEAEGLSAAEIARRVGVTKARAAWILNELSLADQRCESATRALALCLCGRPAQESGLCEMHEGRLGNLRRRSDG